MHASLDYNAMDSEVNLVLSAVRMPALIDLLYDEDWAADKAEELLYWLCLGQHLSPELKQKHTVCITQSPDRRQCMAGLLCPVDTVDAEFFSTLGTASSQLQTCIFGVVAHVRVLVSI